MANRYYIEVPITGVLHIEVEADTQAEAIEKALDVRDLDGLERWNPVEHITRGNGFYGVANDLRFISAEDEDGNTVAIETTRGLHPT